MMEHVSQNKKNAQARSIFQKTSGGPYRVALLCGGTSSEREVSLASAENVDKTLSQAGHEVEKIDTASPDFLATIQRFKPDVAFIALHGKGGEDGTMQAVLELLNIPYTGSGVLGSALAMDKHRSKIIYKAKETNTAPWIYLTKSERGTAKASPKHIIDELGLPVVVKPSDDGSSVGVTIVKESEMLEAALASAFSLGANVLVEKYIKGIEITVPVIGADEPVALPVIEIIPINEFYDYESKYAEGGSEHIIPARISEKALSQANRAALIAHESLGCFGVSRTDMIVDSNDDVWVIETNTIPGMTGTSLLPDAAGHAGIDSVTLYELFIDWALERDKKPESE